MFKKFPDLDFRSGGGGAIPTSIRKVSDWLRGGEGQKRAKSGYDPEQEVIFKLRQKMADMYFPGLHLRGVSFGEHSISMSPGGVDKLQFTDTGAVVATTKGDIYVDSVDGKIRFFDTEERTVGHSDEIAGNPADLGSNGTMIAADDGSFLRWDGTTFVDAEGSLGSYVVGTDEAYVTIQEAVDAVEQTFYSVNITNAAVGLTTDAADVDAGVTVTVLTDGDATTAEVTRVVINEAATATLYDAATGKYWLLKSAADATSYFVWYDVTDGVNAPMSAPAPGGTAIKVDIVAADNDVDVATKTATAIGALGDFGATNDPITVSTPVFIKPGAYLEDVSISRNYVSLVGLSGRGAAEIVGGVVEESIQGGVSIRSIIVDADLIGVSLQSIEVNNTTATGLTVTAGVATGTVVTASNCLFNATTGTAISTGASTGLVLHLCKVRSDNTGLAASISGNMQSNGTFWGERNAGNETGNLDIVNSGCQVYFRDNHLFGVLDIQAAVTRFEWLGGSLLRDTDGVAQISTVAAAAATPAGLDGDHFLLYTPENRYKVWFDLDDGSGEPAQAGFTAVEVNIATGDSDQVISNKITAVLDLLGDVGATNAAGASTTVTITNVTRGECRDVEEGVGTAFTFDTTTPGSGSNVIFSATAAQGGVADVSFFNTTFLAEDAGSSAPAIANTGTTTGALTDLTLNNCTFQDVPTSATNSPEKLVATATVTLNLPTEGISTASHLRGTSLSSTVPTSGQVLSFDGTSWTPTAASAISALPDLTDVIDTVTSGATLGTYLRYDTGGNEWINAEGSLGAYVVGTNEAYTTIQLAVDALEATVPTTPTPIYIKPGSYAEDVTIGSDHIVLVGVGGTAVSTGLGDSLGIYNFAPGSVAGGTGVAVIQSVTFSADVAGSGCVNLVIRQDTAVPVTLTDGTGTDMTGVTRAFLIDCVVHSAPIRPTGSITTVAVASLVDGETVVIEDGTNAAITFEFDTSGAPPADTDTIKYIDLSIITTAEDVRDALVTAISAITDDALLINAKANAFNTSIVDLIHEKSGTLGNVTITETVTNGSFVVAGMSGGAGVSVNAIEVGTEAYLLLEGSLVVADGSPNVQFEQVQVDTFANTTENTFFWIYTEGESHYFWYDKGIGPADPNPGVNAGAPTAKVGHTVVITGLVTADQVATATELVIEAVDGLSSTVSTDTVTITHGQSAAIRSIEDGDTGYPAFTVLRAGTRAYALKIQGSSTLISTCDMAQTQLGLVGFTDDVNSQDNGKILFADGGVITAAHSLISGEVHFAGNSGTIHASGTQFYSIGNESPTAPEDGDANIYASSSSGSVSDLTVDLNGCSLSTGGTNNVRSEYIADLINLDISLTTSPQAVPFFNADNWTPLFSSTSASHLNENKVEFPLSPTDGYGLFWNTANLQFEVDHSGSLFYDNTTSGLTATDVAAALDEIVTGGVPTSSTIASTIDNQTTGSNTGTFEDGTGGVVFNVVLSDGSAQTVSSSWVFQNGNEQAIWTLDGGAGAALTDASLTISNELDTYTNDALVIDFDQGISVDTGAAGSKIDIGVTATNTITSGGALTLTSATTTDLRLFGGVANNLTGLLLLDDSFRPTASFNVEAGIRLSAAAADWTTWEAYFDASEAALMAGVNALGVQIGGTTATTFGFTNSNVTTSNQSVYAALDALDTQWGTSITGGEGITSTNDLSSTPTIDVDIEVGAGLAFVSSELTIDEAGATVLFTAGTWTYPTSVLQVTGTPTAGNDAVNKTYADGISAGLDPKESVRLASENDLTTDLVASSYAVGDNTVAATNGIIIAVSGIVDGPFTLGETITEATSGATGVLSSTDSLSAPAVMYLTNIGVAPFTGGLLLTGGASSADVTGGTITETDFLYSDAASDITALALDGFAPADDDRLLVKDQTDAQQNGIYTVNEPGAAGTLPWVLVRSADQDGTPANEVSGGNFTFVEIGTVQEGTGWVVVFDGTLTLNASDMNWTQFSGAGLIDAGAGLTKAGNTLNVGAGNGITVNANDVAVNFAFDWTTAGGQAWTGDFEFDGTSDFDGAVTFSGTVTGDANATTEIEFLNATKLVPEATGNCSLGTPSLKFLEVNALTVTSGDHVFKHSDNGGHYRMTEHPTDGLMIQNENTGEWFKLPMIPCDAPEWLD